MRTPESMAYTEARQEFVAEVHSLKRELAALRAELDAAKAANAELRSDLAAHLGKYSETHECMVDKYRAAVKELTAELDAERAKSAALEAQRDEARELVRRSSGMRSRSLEAIIARWDSERAAPVTNRDAGDESGAAGLSVTEWGMT